MSQGSYEAKLHAFRRTQEGAVISYVVHPNDVSAEMATAALGTRYMVAFAEIGDDGKPKSPAVAELADAGANAPDASRAGANPVRETRKFETLPLSQQAAIRCGDRSFQQFLGAEGDGEAATIVRRKCQVESRSALDDPRNSASRDFWGAIETGYQQWLTTRQYADSRR